MEARDSVMEDTAGREPVYREHRYPDSVGSAERGIQQPCHKGIDGKQRCLPRGLRKYWRRDMDEVGDPRGKI